MVSVSEVPSTTSAAELSCCQSTNRMSGSAVSVEETDPLQIKSVGVDNIRFAHALTGKGHTRREISGHSRREIYMLFQTSAITERDLRDKLKEKDFNMTLKKNLV